jgi:hypothetical protein
MQHEHSQHEDPALAPEGEIVGKPTMLAKFSGKQDAQKVLDALGAVGYPLNDVSVLLRIEGSDQVLDQVSGHVAAGQSVTEEELQKNKDTPGQTVVLLHPLPEQSHSVEAALSQLGQVEFEYSGETHALGRPGGVEREDETVE